MEPTIEVTALSFADVVMVGHQDITQTPQGGGASTTTVDWFAHMRNGNSYLINEPMAAKAQAYLNVANERVRGAL